MSSKQTFEGIFWSTGEDGSEAPGTLRAGPGINPTIEANGELTTGWQETERRTGPRGTTISIASPSQRERQDGPFMVHGRNESGDLFTLLDVLTTFRTLSLFGGTDEERHVVQGTQAIRGAHLTGRDHQFTGFRIRLQYLDCWRSLVGGPSGNCGFSLAVGGTISMTVDEDNAVWIMGQDVPAASLRNLDRTFVRPLVSFFTLATGFPCDLLDMQVRENSQQTEWWTVYSAAQSVDHGVDELTTSQWLLFPVDVEVIHVGTWLDRVQVLGPLPPVVADLARPDSIALETQVLLLTTITEGMHRALLPNHLALDREMADRLRNAAVAATGDIDAESAGRIGSLLGHLEEPGYSARLTSLANKLGSAVPGVTGRKSRWKEAVLKARDTFAHRLEVGFAAEEDVDRYLAILLSLRWFLTGLLLLEADISPEILEERCSACGAYQNFLASVQKLAPDIYV